MTLTTVAINGIAVEDMGLVPINLDQWLAPPTVKYASTAYYNRMGVVPSINGVTYDAPPLVLGIQSNAGSSTLDRTALGNWYAAMQGQLELEVIDYPGRICRGFFQSGVIASTGTTLISPGLQVVGQIQRYDPFWWTRAPNTFGGAATTRIKMPVGTVPTRLRVGLCGPYTTPTLTLRDRTGTAIATMVFTDTAASNTTYLDLDFNGQHIDRWVSGVRSAVDNGFQYLSAGSGFFVVDPQDAPTLETSSGYLSGICWTGWLA